MSVDSEFGRQVDALVAENQHLRVKSDNDNKTLFLMRQQYEALAASVDSMRDDYERKLHRARTECDQAIIKHSAIKSLLLQSADIVMQALRADAGDEAPEKMPANRGPHITDDRLPIARLGNG